MLYKGYDQTLYFSQMIESWSTTLLELTLGLVFW